MAASVKDFMKWYKWNTETDVGYDRVWTNENVITELRESGPGLVTIEKIKAKSQGVGNGTAVMKQILEAADAYDVKLTLVPVPLEWVAGDDLEGGEYKALQQKLIKWYTKLGFKMRKTGMFRSPKPKPDAQADLLIEAAKRIEAAPVMHMEPQEPAEAAEPPVPTEQFMEWYRKETTSVMAGKRMWPGYPAKKVITQLAVYDDMIEISSIYSAVPGKGHATQVLKQIVDAADKFGVKLILEAVPFSNYDRDGTETAKLVRWYKKFGFKGEADMMIREPIIPPWKQPKPVKPKVTAPKPVKPTKPKTWGSPG